MKNKKRRSTLETICTMLRTKFYRMLVPGLNRQPPSLSRSENEMHESFEPPPTSKLPLQV